jgi:hypothetical protein
MRQLLILVVLALGACSSAGGPYPSLQPRAAERIDPRLEPVRPMNDRPATASLVARLAALVEQARAGDAAFEPAASEAERLATAAGAPQSESWIAAEQALSAAIAAGHGTSVALADVDALGANALQTQGGIAPNDLKAIQGAAAEVSAIARRQAARIDAVQNRLGI